MAKFQVTEIPFDSVDTSPTLEDEFTMTAISRELGMMKDPERLKIAALNLLSVTMQRQAIIRSLCKRLAKLETNNIVKTEHKG
tara:strand:+ start:6212 stop:6460 length:249 start_codon:yes stop_codon:yes gene_type:complete